MDVLDWLNTVLAQARWLRSPEEALGLLPDIGVDAPATVQMIEGRDRYSGFPVAFADRLREPVAEFASARLSEQVEGNGGEQLKDLSPDRLGRDALVLALAELLVEAGELGQRSTSLVILELARQCSAICSGDLSGIERRMPALQAQLSRNQPRLAGMDPEQRGAALAKIAWSLSARLSFAWAMAGKLNPTVRPTRLHQALVANKAALVIAHGQLELPRDASLLAALSGIKTARDQLQAVHTGVTAACRHAFSTDTPAAKAVRDLAGTRSDPASLALDPAIATYVLNDLEEIAPSRVLASAGVGRAQVRILTDRRAIPALAAGYARMCRVARSWDLLACAANRCVPIEVTAKKVKCRLGDLFGRPYRLLAPRGATFQAETYIVGVSREHLMESASKKAKDRGIAVFAALSGIWRSLEEEATHLDGLCSPPDGAWYAAFPTGKAAEDFAEKVRRRFRPPLQLDLAPLGPVVSLDHGATVSVRIEGGDCAGGWDGERLRVRGAAVDRALGGVGDGDTHSDLGALGDALARSAKPEPPPPKPAVEEAAPPPPTPTISLADMGADPFMSEAPPADEDEARDSSAFGFADDEAPAETEAAPRDVFSTSMDSLDSDLSFGGDDPFSSAVSETEEPAYKGPDDPFATMQPHVMPEISDTPSLPPAAAADEDAFASIEREEPADDLGGASEDPLISNPPLGEDSLGLPTGLDKDDPFKDSLDASQDLEESSADMDMEIVDDDDSEIYDDPDSAGLFFLPPPTKEQLESLGEYVPDEEEAPPPRTLVPERSLDSLDQSIDEPGTLVPEVSVDAAAGTLVPDDLDAYDFEDEDKEESRISLTPEIAEAGNLLNIESAEGADFGFTSEGTGDLDAVIGQLAESQEVVMDPPSQDRDLGLEEGEEGFMVAGAKDDPFGFAAIDGASDSLPIDVGGVGVSSDDLRHLFEGYVWLEHEGTLVFGRQYGDDRLVDVHRYELGQLDEAYKRFIHDKAEERFIPQTESSLTLADGTPVNDLDVAALKEALAAEGSQG